MLITSAPVTANVMLAVMINLFYGASAFIVRLALVRNFNLEVLYDAVNSDPEIIDSAGCRVLNLMYHNLLIHEKASEMFHETSDRLGATTIIHP